MSFHFKAFEILEALGLVQKHSEQQPMTHELNGEENLLLMCYRSGQIEEWAWEQHRSEHPRLAAHQSRAE
ncbi:hypothetical protein M2360_004090 [Rhizobium sp. SG_E_25_P2]|uniref:hypothetical protein n=1 Tax=Rhizobium sp. SG_E_25_P2 TaxID=2879942 RepID=UPI002476ED60|nr:hypothetical protein [Rhizobium sp. SG_E_25_P2]MDH6268683.1 hypothetical protein [Rhizobium sp. SG_E_25_P2]